MVDNLDPVRLEVLMQVKKICFDTLSRHNVYCWKPSVTASSKFFTFSRLEAGEKFRSPWLQMRATGRLGKVKLLAPAALHTSSDKKQLTFSVWKAEVTYRVCFSGRCKRAQGKTQVGMHSCMWATLADLKWHRKSIHHSWHEEDWTGHNCHWRCNRFLAPGASSVCACAGTQDQMLIGRDCFLWPHEYL